MEKDLDYLKLYEIIVEEEHYYSDQYVTRISFFLKIITTIVGVTIVGIYKASEFYHYLFLLIGPVIIILTSRLGRDSIKRTYQRNMETVTIRAKLEQQFNFTKPQDNQDSEYWINEPLIPFRHIEDRKKFSSSKEFINSALQYGDQKWSGSLFNIFQIIGLAMLLGLLALIIAMPF